MVKKRSVPFTRASDSGSFYALWPCDDREDLATLPVIFRMRGASSAEERHARFRAIALTAKTHQAEACARAPCRAPEAVELCVEHGQEGHAQAGSA
ncbi:hypothetical protein GCM10010517_40800 [Streptosporangium fragile]|uniref:Uncharacterized protein n=1 Tax=Streptosporangium fragile TaxID=46186 RepID=A0ABP6IFN3_9ACTN